MTTPLLTDLHLEVLYQRTTGPVAFGDETYRDKTAGEQPFYAMSAVTFSKEQLGNVRDALTGIAGEPYWHTTEALRLGRGLAIASMAQWIADHAHWDVVTLEAAVTVHGGLPEARQTCLAAVLREVTRGTGHEAVRLVVADSSLDRRTNVADQRTLTSLRNAQDVASTVRLYHGRMRDEPALWAADVLAWAARRAVALDDTRWLALLDPVLTVLDARTGHVLKTQQPQAAAATPGVRQPDGEVPREPAAVAGATLPSTVDGWEAHVFDRGTTVLDSLARQATEIRRALGARGVVAGNSPSAVERRARRRRETEPD